MLVTAVAAPRTMLQRARATGWRPGVVAARRAARGPRRWSSCAGLFAFTDQVIGNLQMATFAAFGGFATLVLASFGGTRRDKLMAHLALAVAGSALMTIGTAVSSSTALAALVTVPVAFAVFFAGVAGRTPPRASTPRCSPTCCRRPRPARWA